MSSDLPPAVEAALADLQAAIAAEAGPVRPRAALRAASRVVETAAFVTAQDGTPADAPALILVAESLARRAEAPLAQPGAAR